MSPIDQPGAGRHFAPGSPLSLDGRHTPAEPAPRLGAHTRQILDALAGDTGTEPS
jgi:2-methylfumaryl-CoA isomerase